MASGTDFIPGREAELVIWGNTFAAELATLATQVGVSTTQVTTFTTLNTAWVNLYNQAQAEATRTRPVLLNKDEAKRAMVANARMLAGIIQKFPGTTNAHRAALGLSVPRERQPIPAPATSPVIGIKRVVGRVVTLTLGDADSTKKRSKGKLVQGASVFSYVGETAPEDPSMYKFEGLTTRTEVELVFGNDVPSGANVFITAFWYSPSGRSGPAATPVPVTLQGGPVTMSMTEPLKLAA